MNFFSVAILGASNDPERFSNKAFLLLKKNGYEVIPVSPKMQNIQGVPVFSDLELVKIPIDTLTVYVNAEISKKLLLQFFDGTIHSFESSRGFYCRRF